MVGSEVARKIFASARQYLDASTEPFRQPGAEIKVAPLTGRNFSYGTALMNIGTKIMARARAEANANLAMRERASKAEYQAARIAEINAKMHRTPMAIPGGGSIDVPDATYGTQYKALHPTPARPEPVRYSVAGPSGKVYEGITPDSALMAEWRTKRDAERAASVGAAAERRFMDEDAPMLGRRRLAIEAPNVDPRYKKQFLEQLNIDPRAWLAHDPGQFPDEKDAQGRPKSNATGRAGATAWRNAEMTRAMGDYHSRRIAQYKATLGAPGAAPDEGDDFLDRFQQSMQSYQP